MAKNRPRWERGLLRLYVGIDAIALCALLWVYVLAPKGVVGLWVGGDYVFYKKFWGTAFVIVLPVALLPWVVHFVIKSIVECFQPEPGEE